MSAIDQLEILGIRHRSTDYKIDTTFLMGMKAARDGTDIFANPLSETKAPEAHKSWEDGYIVQHAIMNNV